MKKAISITLDKQLISDIKKHKKKYHYRSLSHLIEEILRRSLK